MIRKQSLPTWLYLFIFLCLSIRSFFVQTEWINSLGFDEQNILTWIYSAKVHLLPYKDIFYPYGLLSYYSQSMPWVAIGSSLLCIVLLWSMWWVFEKIFINPFYKHLATIVMLIVFQYGSLWSFNRYGVFIVFSLVVGLLFYNGYYRNKLFLFLLGFLDGLITLVYIDQAVYVIIISFVYLCTIPFLRFRLIKRTLPQLITYTFIFLLGLIPSLLLVGLVLHTMGNLSDFLLNFKRFSDISLYAKTPYLHSLRSVYPVINLSVLFLSVLLLCGVIFSHKKISLIVYILLFTTFDLFLLEQKSIIRSTDSQLFFISMLLILFWVYYLFPFAKKMVIPQDTNIVSVLLSIVLAISLVSLPSDMAHYKTIDDLLAVNNHAAYKSALAVIAKDNPKAKIFSYPGDPLFYAYAHQTPPYYLTTYEATPRSAQLQTVDYIEKHAIQYVIINLQAYALMDDVPHYARSKVELQFILSHFSPFEKVANFLILKRNGDGEFFANSLVFTDRMIAHYFLDIHLENIPQSEGWYKYPILQEKGRVITSGTLQQLNYYLATHILSSRNLFMVFATDNDSMPISLEVTSTNNLRTRITFAPCRIGVCIIHLSSIPLFYSPRQIVTVRGDKTPRAKISLVEFTDTTDFW